MEINNWKKAKNEIIRVSSLLEKQATLIVYREERDKWGENFSCFLNKKALLKATEIIKEKEARYFWLNSCVFSKKNKLALTLEVSEKYVYRFGKIDTKSKFSIDRINPIGQEIFGVKYFGASFKIFFLCENASREDFSPRTFLEQEVLYFEEGFSAH